MADVGSGKERHPDFREGGISIAPSAPIQGIHVNGAARHRPDWHAASDYFSVRRNICFDTEHRLGASRMTTKTSNDFIEDQSGFCLCRNSPHFAKELDRLQLRMPTLDRLNQHGSQFVAMFE